jgi:hypothetical protein
VDANWADISGLVLGAIGFVVALWQIVKARNAAEAATRAVESTQADVRRLATIIHAEQVLPKLHEVLEAMGSEKQMKKAHTLCVRLHESLARVSAEGLTDGKAALAIFNNKLHPAVSAMVTIGKVDSAMLQDVRSSIMEIQAKVIEGAAIERKALTAKSKGDRQ